MMPLPTPKKGTAPATGRVKQSRADMLLSATQALAAEQIPEEHTMQAIEGDATAPREPVAGADRAPGQASLRAESSEQGSLHRASDEALRRRTYGAVADLDGGRSMRRVPVSAVRPSPFQPKGRPSAAAVSQVRAAIAECGSLEMLASQASATFRKLSPEAARLAELAYDVSTHGIKTPIEVRSTEDGAIECLAGHRRLAAASLAELETIPALDFGPMSNAAAAATVLRGNLHRENFTTWQEAVLVTEVQERRRADGQHDTVRSLGAVMGWSHGKVNTLLRIRRAFPEAILARIGDGDAARAEEALSRAAFRDLERLSNEAVEDRRVEGTRNLFGWNVARTISSAERSALTYRPKRGGGYLIDVREPVEAMTVGDATVLNEVLEAQLVRVRGRLEALRARRPDALPDRSTL